MIVRAFSVTSFVLTGLLLVACAGEKDMSRDTVSGKDASVSGAGSRTAVADNPLQACLKSIPKESSVGQRGFAEQTLPARFRHEQQRYAAVGVRCIGRHAAGLHGTHSERCQLGTTDDG